MSFKKFIAGSVITLTSNEMKDIIKVITSVENRGILLRGTTEKVIIEKGGFLMFLVH